jgi:hypothetical protein
MVVQQPSMQEEEPFQTFLNFAIDQMLMLEELRKSENHYCVYPIEFNKLTGVYSIFNKKNFKYIFFLFYTFIIMYV